VKRLLPGLLLVLAPAAFAAPASTHCGSFSSDYSVSRPLSIREIERKEMANIAAMPKELSEGLPKKPFAYGYEGWVAFKSRMRPGERIVEFTSGAHSWQHLAGEAGYARMRGNCVIERFVTIMN